MVPFNGLRFILVSYSNFSIKLAVSERVEFKKCRDLEARCGSLKVIEDDFF